MPGGLLVAFGVDLARIIHEGASRGKKEALGLRFVRGTAKGNKFERLLVLDFGCGAVLDRAAVD